MKFLFSRAAKFLLPVLLLPVLISLPATASETVVTPLEDAPHQSRLGDCLSSSATPVLYGHRDFRGGIYRISRSENRLSGGHNDIFGSACVPALVS